MEKVTDVTMISKLRKPPNEISSYLISSSYNFETVSLKIIIKDKNIIPDYQIDQQIKAVASNHYIIENLLEEKQTFYTDFLNIYKLSIKCGMRELIIN